MRGVRSVSKEKPGRLEKSIAGVWTKSLQDALLVLGRLIELDWIEMRRNSGTFSI